jgi:hypothetical protein
MECLATVVVGLIGSTIATVAILANRKTSRQKSAIDVVMDMQESGEILKKLAVMREMHDSPDASIEQLAKKGLADGLAEKAKIVREVLMFCETLSSGVRNGIYDEKIIRDNISTTLINIWDMSESFIKRVRVDRKNKAFYEHFEWLVERFKKHKAKQH